MQNLYDLIAEIAFRFINAALDILEWLMNLVPAPTFSLQTYFNGLPSDALMLLGYCNVWTAFGLLASAYAIRAVLMVFGR